MFGGPMFVPPKCMPSPRTVARVASRSRGSSAAGATPFNLRRGLHQQPRFETLVDDVEFNSGRNTPTGFINLRAASPRSYPITHPPCDPPLCSVSCGFIHRVSVVTRLGSLSDFVRNVNAVSKRHCISYLAFTVLSRRW